MLYRLRTDMATQGHRHEVEQGMLERAVEEDAARERSKLEAAQAKLVGIVTETATHCTCTEYSGIPDLLF